jgi:hypothetical protein
MSKHLLALSGVVLLIGSTAYANVSEHCDQKMMTSLQECERIVGSLRADKAGQMRVFASDGSEFTAGQATWMKGQLKRVVEDCAGGDVADATRRLSDVQELLKEHHRPA